jgi:hypothetical protein
MTPDQIQNKLNELQSRIERIENELGLAHPDYFAMPLKSNLSEKPNSYDHLLPTGYEFCTEEQAVKWVKVESIPSTLPIGSLFNNFKGITYNERIGYRPIRPIQYHVAVHEAVTAESNPYSVDWSNAPEEADTHCF